MKFTRTLAVAAVLAILFTTSGTGQNPAGPPPGGGFPDLVGALKAVPGCIGVETARTASGKQVIFAWFENKKAVLNWYYSPTHQAVMKSFAGYQPRPVPMADIPDDGQPVLAIASLTMVDKPSTGVTGLPMSQIAIELYRPLPGGVALGGRFAPAALKVPGLVDVTAAPPTR